jgi:ketosteroid isomerase-like protein
MANHKSLQIFWFTIPFFVFLIMFSGVSCQPAADETATVEAVVQSFIEALNAGDVEGALAFLADDAVVQLIPPPEPAGDGLFTGKEEIRGWYEFQAEGNSSNELSHMRINGDQVTALIRFSDEGLKQMGVDFLDNEWVATVERMARSNLTLPR